METVPPVVGVQVMVVGSPALIMKPDGRVKGLGPVGCCVATKERKALAKQMSEARIVNVKM